MTGSLTRLDIKWFRLTSDIPLTGSRSVIRAPGIFSYISLVWADREAHEAESATGTGIKSRCQCLISFSIYEPVANNATCETPLKQHRVLKTRSFVHGCRRRCISCSITRQFSRSIHILLIVSEFFQQRNYFEFNRRKMY